MSPLQTRAFWLRRTLLFKGDLRFQCYCGPLLTIVFIRYIEFTSNMLDKETGLLLKGNFGDWLAVFKVDTGLVSSSFFVRNLNVAAAIARVLGFESDAVKYETLSRAISQAFVKQWWNSTANRFDTQQGFQSAVALPLMAGICGASALPDVSASCARAVADITMQGECPPAHDSDSAVTCAHSMHVTGGIMGAEALLPALSMAGRSDVAIAVALQGEFPSWAAMTRDGSGALWERWDGDLSDPEGSSRNHVMFSSLRTWAGVVVAGLSALAPAWASALVAPDRHIVHSNTSNISSASGSCFTPAGTVSTSWSTAHRTDGENRKSVRLSASFPPSVTGVVCVPCFDCSSAIITEGSAIVWNGSKGFLPGVAGIRSAALRHAHLLVMWSLAYPGAGASVATGDAGSLSTCFEVDSGDYVFESD